MFAFCSLVNVTHDRGLLRCSAFYLCCAALSSICSNTWKASRSLPLAPYLFCSLTPFPWLLHRSYMDRLFIEMCGAGVLAKEIQFLFMGTTRLNSALLRHHPQSVQPQPRQQHLALLRASEINPRALKPACWTRLCFLPDSLQLEWPSCSGHSVYFPASPS